MSDYISADFVKDLLPDTFLPDKPLEKRLSEYVYYSNKMLSKSLKGELDLKEGEEKYPLTPKDCFNE